MALLASLKHQSLNDMAKQIITRAPMGSKNLTTGGEYRGLGEPTKYGCKRGGFTDIPYAKGRMPNSKPPRKMG